MSSIRCCSITPGKKATEVLEETLVKDAIRENGAVTGVVAVGKDGVTKEYRAPMTIDCSGRDALLASAQRLEGTR